MKVKHKLFGNGNIIKTINSEEVVVNFISNFYDISMVVNKSELTNESEELQPSEAVQELINEYSRFL